MNYEEEILKKIFVIRRHITNLHRACYDISRRNKKDAYHYLRFMSTLEYSLENLDLYYNMDDYSLVSYIIDVKTGLINAKNNFELDEYDVVFKLYLIQLEKDLVNY